MHFGAVVLVLFLDKENDFQLFLFVWNGRFLGVVAEDGEAVVLMAMMLLLKFVLNGRFVKMFGFQWNYWRCLLIYSKARL